MAVPDLRRKTMPLEAGFSTVETLVAAAAALLVISAALALVHVQVRLARAQPGLVDVTERARALTDVTFGDLALAGAGFAIEGGDTALACCLPAVHPRRIGTRDADPPGTARGDLVTIAYVPRGAPRLRTAAALSAGSLALVVSPGPPCPSALLCGLADRDDVVVFDGAGQHDYFRVAVSGALGALVPRQPGPPASYDAGAYLARVETHTYYYDAAASQIRHYDGYLTDSPVVDNVVSFQVEYFGEDLAPLRPKPPAGTANCLYDSTGMLVPWPHAIGASADLVPIPLAAFTDGPWCGQGDNRFDADLLRIRRVRMSADVQASDALRAAGTLFQRPGRSNAALSMVPDVSVTVDVAPRSLNAGR